MKFAVEVQFRDGQRVRLMATETFQVANDHFLDAVKHYQNNKVVHTVELLTVIDSHTNPS